MQETFPRNIFLVNTARFQVPNWRQWCMFSEMTINFFLMSLPLRKQWSCVPFIFTGSSGTLDETLSVNPLNWGRVPEEKNKFGVTIKLILSTQMFCFECTTINHGFKFQHFFFFAAWCHLEMRWLNQDEWLDTFIVDSECAWGKVLLHRSRCNLQEGKC